MKRIISARSIVVAVMLVVTLFAGLAAAEEMKMVGALVKIELAADGKSAVATLKDNKTGEAVAITITDELTLDKFKDKRIVEGDEIRSKYDKQDGKNLGKIFKKQPAASDTQFKEDSGLC